MRTVKSGLRVLFLAAAGAACVVAVPLGAGGAERAVRVSEDAVAPKCAGAAKPVRRLGARRVERAVACRVGVERTAKGHPAGRLDDLLDVAADSHAQRMVRQDCFSHRCPGEADLEERLKESGYLEGASDWSFAENIGCATTVDAMVRAWLRDRSSRRNLLGDEFEDLGIGFTKRSPRDCEGPPQAGAFTLVLGVVKR